MGRVIEYKATEPIQLSELNTDRRTAVIAHASYGNIDKKKDIATRGMFTKSWKENKAIDFLIDHDKSQKPGKVTDLYDDEKKAYTKVKFGSHTLGTDTMLMMDEGIIRGASFGFYTIKANKKEIKGQKVRELVEVLQDETTVTYALEPVNDMTGIVRVTKAMIDNFDIETKALSTGEKNTLLAIVRNDQSTLEELIKISATLDVNNDLYTWISWNISRRADMMGDIRSQLRYNASQMGELKAHLSNLERFSRNSNASDDCIKTILGQVEEVKSIISTNDTADTHQYNEPAASVKEFSNALHLLSLKF